MAWNRTIARMKGLLRRLSGAALDDDGGAAEPLRDRPVEPPAMDVYQGAEGMLLEIELPGARPRDVGVSLDGNRLTVQAPSMAEPRHRAWAREWTERGWQAVLDLPEDVDGSRAAATLRDGLLSLRIPRRRDARGRAIPVR